MKTTPETTGAATPEKNPHAVALGRLGGLGGRGVSKSRGTAKARKAANARWRAYRQRVATAAKQTQEHKLTA